MILHHNSKRRKGVVVITPEWTLTNATSINPMPTLLGVFDEAGASSFYDAACLPDEVLALINSPVASSAAPASNMAVQQGRSPGAIERNRRDAVERKKEPCSICHDAILSELKSQGAPPTLECTPCRLRSHGNRFACIHRHAGYRNALQAPLLSRLHQGMGPGLASPR